MKPLGTLLRLAIVLAVVAALGLCLRRWVVGTVRVAGTSMQDTLVASDVALITRFDYRGERVSGGGTLYLKFHRGLRDSPGRRRIPGIGRQPCRQLRQPHGGYGSAGRGRLFGAGALHYLAAGTHRTGAMKDNRQGEVEHGRQQRQRAAGKQAQRGS